MMPADLLSSQFRFFLRPWWPALLLLVGCATAPPPLPGPPPEVVRADVLRHMPANVDDRMGWAVDIQRSFASLGIAPYEENICAMLAVIEQETGYDADPVVPGLARIAREEIYQRANGKHIPDFLVDAALKIRSSDGRSYAERLVAVRTEHQLSQVFGDLIGRVPLGHRLFGGFNPVDTAGPMQVSIAFAQDHADDYPYPVANGIRAEVFTRRGGLYFGMANLLGFATPYVRKIHRFADFNAGWYASRNAAFQNAVALVSGRELALDGDLLVPDSPMDRPGETERALRSLSSELGMDAGQIRDALDQGRELGFNDGLLFRKVFALADARVGKHVPRAMIPQIRLHSPKISRKLTTEWFARRVYGRYRECMARN